MFTDRWFLHGAVEAAKKHHGDAYLYLYDHLHAVSFNDILDGAGIIKSNLHLDTEGWILFSLYFPLSPK